MLTSIADGLWSTTRPLRFFGIETGTRMTIVRLADGVLAHGDPIETGGTEVLRSPYAWL